MPAELPTVDDVLGRFAEDLRAQLERSLGIRFLPGYLQGPNESSDHLGSVYVRVENEVSERILEWQLTVVVRILLQFDQSALQDKESPWDPKPLYVYAAALKQAVKAHQTDLGAWFQRVTQVEIDPGIQGLTAQVLAYTDNPGL